MKRKNIMIILFIALLLSPLFISGIRKIESTMIEKRIVELVKEDKQNIIKKSKEMIEASKNRKSLHSKYKSFTIDGVYGNQDTIMVQYSYMVGGIASNSKYYGIYYSEKDLPSAYQNKSIYLEKSGNKAWKWSELSTDNGGLTKKIFDNIYYYEAWF